MRTAPLVFLTLTVSACGGGSAERAAPAGQATADGPVAVVTHPLIGGWRLMQEERGGGIRLEVRVDSVARDSAYGALTFFMAGDAGFLVPADWGPLAGTVAGDTVDLLIGAGERAPAIALAGRLRADTIHLALLRLGLDPQPGAWRLVRTTAPRP